MSIKCEVVATAVAAVLTRVVWKMGVFCTCISFVVGAVVVCKCDNERTEEVGLLLIGEMGVSVFTLFIGMIFPAAGPTLEFILYDILSWPIIIASVVMSFYYIYLNFHKLKSFHESYAKTHIKVYLHLYAYFIISSVIVIAVSFNRVA